jgi:6-phosphogluconolactonase
MVVHKLVAQGASTLVYHYYLRTVHHKLVVPIMHAAYRLTLCLTMFGSYPLASTGMANGEPAYVFVGTYTRGTDSRGIYVYRFDNSTGALHETSVAEGIENPSFLAVHPNAKYLYSSDEIDSFENQYAGAVSAFAIDAQSGKLTLLNRQSAGGTSPCHLVVDPAGRHVLVVGYGSGTVAVLPIGDDGQLQPVADLIQHQGSSIDPVRQSSPHPHEIIVAPGGKFALVPDLGLDQILQYRFNSGTARLTANEPPYASAAPGAGPRHLAFHPDGRRAYVINELDLTVSAFDFDAEHGLLSHLETTSAVPEGIGRTGVSGAEIAVHPSGNFLYASLRGLDQIVSFRIDQSTGRLTPLERISTGGKTPRSFTIDPSGKWLLAANHGSGTIAVFRIKESGQLEATSEQASVPSPVCLQFLVK